MNLSINTIVVPQGAEYQAVCRGLQQKANKIQVIAIPIGTKDVLQVLVKRSFEFTTPQRVLILGLCGSLSQQYSVGDTVLYRDCCNLNRQCLNLEPELTTMIHNKLSLNLVTGLTSDRPICLATQKRKLAQQYAVEVVDMEGYSYIKELQRQGISVAMLRVVSDNLTGNIPNLSPAIDEDGNLKFLPLANVFLRQPIAAIRLIKGSLTGLQKLQQITAKLCLMEMSFVHNHYII